MTRDAIATRPHWRYRRTDEKPGKQLTLSVSAFIPMYGLQGHPRLLRWTTIGAILARLFVYGTLLRGEANHTYLHGQRFVRETATGPGFGLVDLGGFPAMIKVGRSVVQGELWEVDAAALARLDQLEGDPDSYWRTTIQLVDGATAQTYLLRSEHAEGWPRLSDGDWRRYARG